MDFIIFFVKLIFAGLTSFPVLLLSILPSVLAILLFRYFIPKKTYEIVDGEIESYRNRYEFKPTFGWLVGLEPGGISFGALEKITLKLVNGERVFFKNMTFRRYLWNSISGGMAGTNSHVGMSGKFCCERTKNGLSVFAFGNENNHFVFLDDMDKIHSIKKVIFNVTLMLFFIFILPYMLMDIPSHEVTERRHNEAFVGIALFTMPFIIIFSYSLYWYIKSFSMRKIRFEKEMQLLEQAGIPKPLG